MTQRRVVITGMGIGDGFLEADGERIYTATDLKVVLSSQKAGG